MDNETAIWTAMRRIAEGSPMRLLTARQPFRADAHTPAAIPGGPITIDYQQSMKPQQPVKSEET